MSMRQRIEEAEGQFEADMLRHIGAAASLVDVNGRRPHWTAAAWLLERRWPTEYGRRGPDVKIEAVQAYQVEAHAPPLVDLPMKHRVAKILELLERTGKLRLPKAPEE